MSDIISTNVPGMAAKQLENVSGPDRLLKGGTKLINGIANREGTPGKPSFISRR
ncbi:hypothetical protein [uncultured Bartonella sp.]|uniref:hypothetical protein n=1 Tax=uncultured Bartonella sp. TaxID=104108 RepID=UPI002619E9D4|nr:hypothetical protein [uncultured Bartonella sp.]